MIGNTVVPGTKFREMFSLASTQIEIYFPGDDTIEIITFGFGHGVGTVSYTHLPFAVAKGEYYGKRFCEKERKEVVLSLLH